MLIRLAAAAALVAAQASAVDWKAYKPEGYLSDYARVVDAGSRAEIERYCEAVKQSTGVEIALVTVPSLEGEPIEDAANTLFRAWGVGEKGKNNGVLLMLAIGDRRSRLEVGYEIEPILTDAYAGRIIDAMRPELRASRYGAALLEAANTIGHEVAKAKGVAIGFNPPRRPRPRFDVTSLPWLWIFGGFIVLWYFGARMASSHYGRRAGSGFWYGGGPVDFGGSSSHGGFGGYDSGSSFGGFGGGDSGGGGASSDW